MGETTEEYQQSVEEYRVALRKWKQDRELASRPVRKPLARSSDHWGDDDDHDNGNGNGHGNGNGNGNGHGNGNGNGHGDTTACSQELMAERVMMYVVAQPVSPLGWTSFFQLLDPNVILGSNLIDAPAGVGKTAVENILLGINTQYQNVSAILSEPANTFGHNKVTSLFSKAQGSIRVGVQYNITIYQEITFSNAPECLVTSIFEFADSGKTAETLSLEFSSDPAALTCERMKWVCGNHMPNFGTQHNNCMLLWKGAPNCIKSDGAFMDDLSLITPSRTLTCANTILSTIQNAGSALPAAEVQFLCSLLGAPIPGVPGCWSATSSSG